MLADQSGRIWVRRPGPGYHVEGDCTEDPEPGGPFERCWMETSTWEVFDEEGRYLEVQLEGLSVVSLYLPSGSSSEERQEAKYRCMESFTEHLLKVRRRRSHTIICGDWNIAHKEIDLRNWRSNRKNSGFLPEERAWMDKVFGEYRYVDAFRALEQPEHQYTWWSNRGRAWDNNVGWRIDYHVVTSGLAERVLRTEIYKDQRFSDHAPLIVDYDWPGSGEA